MTVDRRTMLKAAGTAAVLSTTGLAGCLGGNGDDDDSGSESDALPAYESWIVMDDERATFAYIDWAGLEELEDDADDDEADPTDPEEDDASDEYEDEDPMIAVPMAGMLAVAMGASFGTAGTGLDTVIDMEGDALAADDAETTLEELLLVNDAYVFTGDVDVEEVETALLEEHDDPLMDAATFEQTDEHGEFTVYESEPEDDAESTATSDAVAVSAEAIVLAPGGETDDGIDSLTPVLEGVEGDGERATDAEADIEWLLETAGEGQIVFGGYGEDEDDETTAPDEEELEEPNAAGDEEFDGATGIVASLSLEEDESADGNLAATFDSIDDETESELEADVGSSADDVTLEIDRDAGRVSASATWDADNDALE
ncbi:hypothetical protein [Natronorubrum daqingense]|uniref:Uncharacterized protein n=2 Tax=Natronorubrum daqingense TaxID=588898 RepID=A0A1N7BU40_9EURY|nr:hypothetical protein [Natronorubrum daqingense]SIR54887.1 hypothetical protein SAMN05421809_1360 [Natronorubrum daqingense]